MHDPPGSTTLFGGGSLRLGTGGRRGTSEKFFRADPMHASRSARELPIGPVPLASSRLRAAGPAAGRACNNKMSAAHGRRRLPLALAEHAVPGLITELFLGRR